MKDDWSGLIWLAITIGGGVYLWNWFTDKNSDPPRIETSPSAIAPQRPSGLLSITTLESGTIWRLDADALRGPKEARLAWVIADHGADRSVSKRETKTLYRIDCNTTAYQTLHEVEYDGKGKVLRRWSEAEIGKDVAYPPPQSNIAAVVDNACSDAFSLPKPEFPISPTSGSVNGNQSEKR